MESNQEIVNILKEIHSAVVNGGSTEIITSLIAVIGTLGGVLLGGIFQHYASKRNMQFEQNRLKLQIEADRKKQEFQIKAEVISKQRQQWMDSLRVASKDLLAEFDMVYNFVSLKQGSQQEINELFKSSMAKAVFINLMLNPGKKEQKRITDVIEKTQNHIYAHSKRQSPEDDETYTELRTELLKSLTDLFTITWQRVKSLENNLT